MDGEDVVHRGINLGERPVAGLHSLVMPLAMAPISRRCSPCLGAADTRRFRAATMVLPLGQAQQDQGGSTES